MLVHTLVHALVYNLWPRMDASSPAYLANQRHGPIFQLLNKQLYGHTSDALHFVSQQGSSRRRRVLLG
jgi:hypothetical protein